MVVVHAIFSASVRPLRTSRATINCATGCWPFIQPGGVLHLTTRGKIEERPHVCREWSVPPPSLDRVASIKQSNCACCFIGSEKFQTMLCYQCVFMALREINALLLRLETGNTARCHVVRKRTDMTKTYTRTVVQNALNPITAPGAPVSRERRNLGKKKH